MFNRKIIENVSVKVTLAGARNLKGSHPDKPVDPYVRVRLGKHSLHKTKHLKKTNDPEWNETFSTKVFATSSLDFMVRDHHTLSDHDIGEVVFNVAENVDEGRPFDGWLSLVPEGSGEIHVQVEVVSG